MKTEFDPPVEQGLLRRRRNPETENARIKENGPSDPRSVSSAGAKAKSIPAILVECEPGSSGGLLLVLTEAGFTTPLWAQQLLKFGRKYAIVQCGGCVLSAFLRRTCGGGFPSGYISRGGTDLFRMSRKAARRAST